MATSTPNYPADLPAQTDGAINVGKTMLLAAILTGLFMLWRAETAPGLHLLIPPASMLILSIVYLFKAQRRVHDRMVALEEELRELRGKQSP